MPGRRQSDREHQQIEGGGAPTNQMAPRQIDPSDPNEKKRVHRGGSVSLQRPYCSRYIVGTRGKAEVNTGTNHLDFVACKTRPQ